MQIHKGIMEGITDEEKQLFLRIVKKMEQNLSNTKAELFRADAEGMKEE